MPTYAVVATPEQFYLLREGALDSKSRGYGAFAIGGGIYRRVAPDDYRDACLYNRVADDLRGYEFAGWIDHRGRELNTPAILDRKGATVYPKEDSNGGRFWMVWRTGTASPSVKHPTRQEAEDEAARIARLPGVKEPVYVLQAVQVFEKAPPPVITRTL